MTTAATDGLSSEPRGGLKVRLRTLEQQVNASDLPDDVKLKLQSYITGCDGSLTSFNVLFADADDHFKGGGGAQ